MDETLLAAYRATAYRVRLARGGWATIRIGQPLPPVLDALTRQLPWGFITAWNPRSQPASLMENRSALRNMLTALRALPDVALIQPAVGVATTPPWREPSLWVVGPGTGECDALAVRFGQLGYIHGGSDGLATLRLTGLA
ncbi:DUF3293 domain-containing protein [Dyella sp. C11]|uniref:DUF3293 domain-containing protein n=1 Tax=Dyella sp. C11 TaxID=2126991 RepID=UPI000D656CC7|nr:DUF3293 domain-containing protein [Dyella sp. C11]